MPLQNLAIIVEDHKTLHEALPVASGEIEKNSMPPWSLSRCHHRWTDLKPCQSGAWQS